jgi:hypothetical protein
MARTVDRAAATAATNPNPAPRPSSRLETLKPQTRRVTLPPNYDPNRVDELQRLLDCREEELKKILAQTLRAGIAQAGLAI